MSLCQYRLLRVSTKSHIPESQSIMTIRFPDPCDNAHFVAATPVIELVFSYYDIVKSRRTVHGT
jgi:hypothetical protein